MALNLIIGKSRAVSELRGLISQAAASDAGVLILGESGTGKELVARAPCIQVLSFFSTICSC